MRSIKAILLLILIISITGFDQSGSGGLPDPDNGKMEYLTAFAKLYGYIRYFHPSDEAASIDWNKFLCYGIEQVGKATNPNELKNTLDSLFLSIAPTLALFFEGETPEEVDQPENIGDSVLVTWQHKGVAADPNPVFKSIRLNRIDWALYSRFGIFEQFVNSFNCGNKKFKLSANVIASNNGKGVITIFGSGSFNGNYFYRSGTFENVETEPFLLEGVFSEGIDYLVLTIQLLEKGKILINDLEFLLERDTGNLQPFSIAKNQFIADEQNKTDKIWNSNGLGFKFAVEKSNNTTSITVESSDELEYNSLFKKHCLGNEVITKDLGCGIKCRFPPALYLPREQPRAFSEQLANLKNKISQVQLERNSANLEVTRIGVVITAWNIFQHFYPYFDVVDQDWENVLKQTLTEVQDNQDEKDFLISLRRMTAALNDGHIRILHPSEGNLKALPVIFDYLEEQVVVIATSSDQLQKGDILLEVDGKPASELLFNCEEIMSGSPQWKKQKALREFTKDDSTKISNVKIRRGEEVLEVSVARTLQMPQYDRPENVCEIKDNIYYVNLCKANIEEILNRIQDILIAKGVVFDLRGYPHSNHSIISYMIDSPVQSAKWLKPEIIYPDHENIAGYDTSGRWRIEPMQPRIQGRIVFITDENAISYGESFMGIGFSVDKIGELDTLRTVLSKSFFPGNNSMTRTVDSIIVPWFDVLFVNDFSLMDSAFMAQLHFWFWMMEYRTEYFEYNNYAIVDNKLTRENYLERYASQRKNKILKNFTGLVIKLNPGETKYLTKFFNSIGYEKLNGNEYRSPDNFTFQIKNRDPGDHNSIETIQFETTSYFSNKRVIQVSDHVLITLEGDRGQILIK